MTPDNWPEFTDKRDRFVARLPMAVCDGCDGCGQRCTSGFPVSLEEAVEAFAAFGRLPAAERRRVDSQPLQLPWPGDVDRIANFHRCRFRDAEFGRCSIYASRPTVCRLFGHVDWLPCPIEAVRPERDEARQLWREYRDRELRTFEEWEQLGTVQPLDPTACATVDLPRDLA